MMRLLTFLAVVAAAIAFTVLCWPVPKASALSDPLGFVRAYSFSCTTSAALITSTTGNLGQKSMLIWNNSTTPVYIGGSDVDTSTKGFPICTDSTTCLRPDMPIDAQRVVWCKAGSSVTVKVLAGY